MNSFEISLGESLSRSGIGLLPKIGVTLILVINMDDPFVGRSEDDEACHKEAAQGDWLINASMGRIVAAGAVVVEEEAPMPLLKQGSGI
jgi:hypothetical protein